MPLLFLAAPWSIGRFQ